MSKKFKVESGELLISDPCYDLPVEEFMQLLVKAENGYWQTKVNIKDNRISELIAEKIDVEDEEDYRVIGTIAVDSGQAGIFDYRNYKDDDVIDYEPNIDFGDHRGNGDGELWYRACAAKTLNTEENYGVIPFGVVSESGYGDGRYEVSAKVKDDKATTIKIKYI